MDPARRLRGDGNEIEILDPDNLFAEPGTEVVESEPATSLSPLAVTAGLIVATVAAFGVVTAGNTPAPEPPPPSVTAPPATIPPEEAALAAEVAELEATYGVEIGDGPALNWQRLVWNIDVDRFQWVTDGFVGDNGETEWTIRPSMVGPTVSQRDSLEATYPDYEVQLVEGARVLVPRTGAADHVLVTTEGRDLLRVELPAFENAPASELVRSRRVILDGVVDGERLVLSSLLMLEVDLDALGERVGRDLSDFEFVAIGERGLLPRDTAAFDEPAEPIDFDEAGFTEAERTDLLRINDEASRPEVLALSLVSAGFEVVPLPDLQWAQNVSLVSNGVAVAWMDADDQNWLSTSSEVGIWSTRPLAVDDGDVWHSGSRMYTFPGSGRSIRRSNDVGRTWERTRRPFVSSVNALAIDDVLIVAEEPPANGDVPDLAVTRWDTAVGDPEWRIESLDEVFAKATDVEFVVGDSHILAVVTTPGGTDYYLANADS